MEDRIAYFDNAATTFPKPEAVYGFADAFYRTCGGNAGRGGNALAVGAGRVARQAKENLREMYGCPDRKVAFTASATDALNRVIFGLGLERGDTVYVTPFEHNAVTRPLSHLAKTKGIRLEVLPFDSATLLPKLDEIEATFAGLPPSLVVMTHASNVCGAVVPVLEIARLAKRHGSTVVVDMSQTAGLLPLDLSTPLVDFAVFAGHKTLYGPFGVGGLMCVRSGRLQPLLLGGNGIDSANQDMPEDIEQMIEVGSQNAYAIAGLKASTDWLLGLGLPEVSRRESEALDALLSILCNHGTIEIVGQEMSCDRIGVVSARFVGYSPDEAEMALGKFGVAVRSGLHCSPFAHRFLGTLPEGTVRFSVGALTTAEDLERLEGALEALSETG